MTGLLYFFAASRTALAVDELEARKGRGEEEEEKEKARQKKGKPEFDDGQQRSQPEPPYLVQLNAGIA
jgi:hypothetical protein